MSTSQGLDTIATKSSTTPKSSKKLPFSSSERELIVALVRDHPIIENKRTNAKNIELKRQAWDELAVAYNSQSYVFPRNSTQLKRCWENIKTQRKKELSQESSYMIKTGGGLSQGSPPVSENIVDVICPFINLKVPGVIDSNSIEISKDLMKDSYLNETIIEPSRKRALIDITNQTQDSSDIEKNMLSPPKIPYTPSMSTQNVEGNVPSQPKKKCFKIGGTTSVENKISSEIKLRIDRCSINIQQDQELHKLRMEREKILIQREKNILNFEKEMHTLQIEKLKLEVQKLKQQ